MATDFKRLLVVGENWGQFNFYRFLSAKQVIFALFYLDCAVQFRFDSP